MIRYIIAVLFLILFLIPGLCMFIPVLIIRIFSKKKSAMFAQRIVKGGFRVILFISGAKTTVIGAENIPTEGPVLFVGNHRSLFDILIAYTRINLQTGIVAKKEFSKTPIFSWWMRAINCLFMDRDNIREGMKTILKGIDYIKKDRISLMIYPEGTRSKSDETLPFKEGSLKLAEKSGCAIIPFCQNNTEAVFEKQFPKLRPVHTILEFGKPVYIKDFSELNKKFPGAYLRTIIQEMYEKNKKEK